MTVDPITDELLKSWERAGDIHSLAAKELRAELEEEVENEQRKTVTIKPRGINKELGITYGKEGST